MLELIRDYACEVCHLDDRIMLLREQFESCLNEKVACVDARAEVLARRLVNVEAERLDALATRAHRHTRKMAPIVWPGWSAPMV